MKLKRDINALGILFASVSAIIGSGWLFGSLYAAQMAGPAAIFSWIIGGVAIIFIAFCFAELACLFPVAGGIGVFPLFSHGRTVSFAVSWLSWLAFILIAPIEVQAVVQYAANYFPALVRSSNHTQHLTSLGLGIAFCLLSLLTLVNSISIQFMSKTNVLLTLWKLAVPILVIIFFFHQNFQWSNLTQFGGFAPEGVHGVFSSLAVGGVILAFNGFQPGIALAGETKNPQKNIPIAILGSLLICTTIYCLLQLAFLTAIPSHFLHNGWRNLSFEQEAGPLAGLSVVLGLVWLAKCLYADALISPMGSAAVFYAAAARTSYAMSRNNFLPPFFQKLTRNGVPIWGVLFNFFISCFIFLVFTGWQEMAAFYAAAICLCNSFIPLVLVSLRRHQKETQLEPPFRIPFYFLFCFVSFIISNLMLYWCGWEMIFRLDIALVIGFFLTGIGGILRKDSFFPDKKPAWILLLLMLFISGLSKLGSFGGVGVIGTKMELILVTAASAIVFFSSLKLAQNASQIIEKIQCYEQS